jgi:hypothetical protein
MIVRTIYGCRYQANTLGLLALIVAALGLSLYAQPSKRSDHTQKSPAILSSASAQTPEAIIRQWPERARSIVRVMIQTYGQPNRISAGALVWHNNGPWRKTVVYRKARSNSRAMRGQDYLEQTVGYQVPDDKINALRRFNRRIAVSKAKDELSCRSDSEKLNILALNLADDIVNYRRSVEDARYFYRQAVRLAMSGKSSMYLDELLFQVHNGESLNPKDVKKPGKP